MSDTLNRIGTPGTDLAEFVEAIEKRLEIGAREYADRPAATRPPLELVDEIAQELVDVAGWSFLLWCRIEGLRERLRSVPVGTSTAQGASGALPDRSAT